jgi:hypothetical protein
MSSLPFRSRPQLVPAVEQGPPGRDADTAEVLREIGQQIAALPRPRDGIDGKSADSDAIVAAIRDAAQALLSVMPQDGEPGTDGKDGKDGKDGRPGRDGRDASAVSWRFEVFRREDGLIDHVLANPLSSR